MAAADHMQRRLSPGVQLIHAQRHRRLTDPAARATSRIPPCPSARASAPISSRRCRSSRCGKITSNFAPASPG
jgi:hypothetical protein